MEQKRDNNRMVAALAIPVIMLIIMWTVYILMRYFGFEEWIKYGLIPRETDGLIGIITWPFIHSISDSGHIINNSLPTLVLGWALFYFYSKKSWQVLILIWLLNGFCVWVAARDAIHIGMSGIIYGLAAFLFTGGLLNRNRNLLGVSLIVTFLYGSMIWGIFPIEERISWEGHLWGAVSGVVFAWVFREKGPRKPQYSWETEDDLPDDGPWNETEEQTRNLTAWDVYTGNHSK
jgi:membrane associated rhomboid family serine protease